MFFFKIWLIRYTKFLKEGTHKNRSESRSYTLPFPPSLLVVIYKAFCLDVAQGHVNGVPNETQTYLWRFASLATSERPPCHSLIFHHSSPIILEFLTSISLPPLMPTSPKFS